MSDLALPLRIAFLADLTLQFEEPKCLQWSAFAQHAAHAGPVECWLDRPVRTWSGLPREGFMLQIIPAASAQENGREWQVDDAWLSEVCVGR